MADIAGVSETTVRNYTKRFGELLSPRARGDLGPRLFNDEDIQIFCAIATLSNENLPRSEIIERIKAGDVFIDHTTPQQATPGSTQHAPSPQAALEAPQMLMLVRSDLQRQINEIKRTQRSLEAERATERHKDKLQGALWGAVAALALAGFVLWLLYLLAG